MSGPGLAEHGASRRVRWVCFVCSNKCTYIPVLLPSVTTAVILMTRYLNFSWVLCGPVSNSDTDPLVQLVEVLEIGGNGGVCFPKVGVLKYDHESFLARGL